MLSYSGTCATSAAVLSAAADAADERMQMLSIVRRFRRKLSLRGDVSKNETLLYQMGVHFKR